MRTESVFVDESPFHVHSSDFPDHLAPPLLRSHSRLGSCVRLDQDTAPPGKRQHKGVCAKARPGNLAAARLELWRP